MKNPSQIIKEIKQTLPPYVQLVAVSKFHPACMIEEAYAGGHRMFGESHVQELQQKYEVLPKDIEWHFIGHLQTNKVKYIAPYVRLIHAVDTHKLLEEINKQAQKCNRIIDCLLELHIAQEETKYGFSADEMYNYVKQGDWRQLENVRICGLMCMASNVEDEAQIANEFNQAETLFRRLKQEFFAQQDSFSIRVITLKIDGKLAEMVDKTWTNPFHLVPSTKGAYSFWVKSIPAKESGERAYFNFSIEIEAEGYSESVYLFEVPIMSEDSVRKTLDSTYTLKMKDLVIFKK